MKKLILSLTFIPFLGLAQEVNLSDAGIKSKFLTVVKDAEVEGLLGKTAQFQTCKDKNKFDPKADATARSKSLDAATKCFASELSKNKDPEALKKLAENLNLQDYGLIKSKNVSEITSYLSKKMRKALTGIDPDDKNASKKWEDQKIVDQKVFVDLYTNQLMKSALFEVSRYCFENLEIVNEDKTGKDFVDYWKVKKIDWDNPITSYQTLPSYLSDTGATSFELVKTGTDVTKKENVYGDIKNGISKIAIDPKEFGQFFTYCQSAIKYLCEAFRKDSKIVASLANKVTLGTTPAATGGASGGAAPGTSTLTPVMTRGANACITMDKLQGIRTTMANTAKVAAQFDEMEDKNSFAIQMIKNPKIYQRGKGDGEESLDELTSYSSADMLQDGGDDKLSDLETKCAQGGGGQECEQFLVENDSLEKAIHNVESDMNLKREIEMARVEELKNKPDDLKKYLTDNGMFELLAKLDDKTLDANQIADEIKKIYDARKVAEIENLKLKVGKRQVTEAEASDLESSGEKNKQIVKNIKETKEERARLAQVVMFNNIITSQLELFTDKDAKNSIGKNVNAWKKEMKGLEDSNSYDSTLFSGVQDVADKEGSKLEDTSVVSGGIIDSILGKKPD
ncbi:MAG: hypothetical protein H0V66_07555 [Bdellovibrionales bacterium]|nr:hypothetical protein [Bdellovibrionales bacterium]